MDGAVLVSQQVLAEHTGVGLEDIITQQWTSTAFDPGSPSLM